MFSNFPTRTLLRYRKIGPAAGIPRRTNGRLGKVTCCATYPQWLPT